MTSEPDDVALLARVARDHEEGALAMLYARHEKAAYNLALFLTSSPEAAEEAVQEAMLRVWKSAATFRSENARAWLLRIVARESLRVIKAGEAEQRKRKAAQVAENTCMAGAPGEELETHEQLAWLRRLLAELPLADRQIVALHFASGMTHAEIGNELALPRQTVSCRLSGLLDELRAKLARAGFTAVLAFDAESYSEAVCSGASLPLHLRDRVLGYATQPRRALVQRHLLRNPVGHAVVAFGAVIALPLLIAGGWICLKRHSSSSETNTPDVAPDGIAATARPIKGFAAGWQSVAIEPRVQRTVDDQPRAAGAGAVFGTTAGGDAEWAALEQADGAMVEQTKSALIKRNMLCLGEPTTLPREWTGLIDYSRCDPTGTVGFAIFAAEGAGLLGLHRQHQGTARFRLVAWRRAGGEVVCCARSLRYLPDNGVTLGKIELCSKANEVGLALCTTTAVTFRALRTRPLPPDWTPESDAEAALLLGKSEKAAGKDDF